MQKCSAWGTALSPIPRYTVVLKRLCKTLETCEEYLRKHYLGTQFEKKKKKSSKPERDVMTSMYLIYSKLPHVLSYSKSVS